MSPSGDRLVASLEVRKSRSIPTGGRRWTGSSRATPSGSSPALTVPGTPVEQAVEPHQGRVRTTALSRENSRRITLAAIGAGALLVVAACGPPMAPRPPVSTTTVPTQPPCTVDDSAGSSSAGGSGGAAAVAEDPPVLTGSEEITTAANAAVKAAVRAGADEVTVVAVDDAGRPSIEPVPLADAVGVALATAESLDLVAVEAPSYAEALETTPQPSDPDVDKQWAMSAFPFSALWSCGKGAGLTVAVVDSGVQANHPDMAGRVRPGAAIVNGVVQTGAGGTDVNGHGTHVAGIMAAGENGVGTVGVAPQVTILPVRVLDAQGVGPNSDIGKGITWAVDHGAKVVNVSIGSDTKAASVTAAVSYAVDRGVVVVAAAGNGGPEGNPRYPAALPETIAVGALGQNGDVASYSTNGSYVDVTAPGSNIYSTKIPSTWGLNTGTSMASPHVAALIALIIDARGSVSPANMLRRLTSTATDAGPPGFDPAYGWGCINPIAAVNAR